MKILYITSVPPSPRHSGTGIRLFNVLRALTALGQVTLVSLVSEEEKELLGECRSLTDRVVTVDREGELERLYPSAGPTTVWMDLWNAINTLEPIGMKNRNGSELAGVVKLFEGQGFDLMWITKSWVAGLLPFLDWRKVVVDLDDLEHRVKWRTLKLSSWYPTIIFDYANIWKQRMFERRLCKRAASVLVCSEDDRQILAHNNVRVLPNCVDVSEGTLDGVRGNPYRLLYVGNFKYAPNVDATLFFCKSILPHIRRVEPRAHVYIVGRAPPKEISALHTGVDVIVTGTVPDVTPYFNESGVVIVPLRVGGGTRVKILEAFAHRKAVVSTRIGAEGLQVEDGIHLYLADKPADFASRCVKLMGDSPARRALGEAGRRLVETHYNQSIFQQTIWEIVSDVTGSECSQRNGARIGQGL